MGFNLLNKTSSSKRSDWRKGKESSRSWWASLFQSGKIPEGTGMVHVVSSERSAGILIGRKDNRKAAFFVASPEWRESEGLQNLPEVSFLGFLDGAKIPEKGPKA